MPQPAPLFRGEVRTGKLELSEGVRASMAAYLISLSGLVDVIIRPPVYDRSDKQNKYYWGVIVKLVSQESGMSTDAVHEFLKHEHGLKHEVSLIGRKLNSVIMAVPKSTTLYSTGEFEDYALRCRTWASEFFGSADKPFIIPLPNEVVIE